MKAFKTIVVVVLLLILVSLTEAIYKDYNDYSNSRFIQELQDNSLVKVWIIRDYRRDDKRNVWYYSADVNGKKCLIKSFDPIDCGEYYVVNGGLQAIKTIKQLKQ